MRRLTMLFTLIVFFIISTVSFAGSPQTLANLIKEKRNSEAYSLAKTMESKYEGNPHFDYMFGIAALRSGHADEASFAFERLLMNHPNNQRIRLEYALSQYMLNNNTVAKSEFERVLQSNPPQNVRDNVNNFLEAIERRQSQGGKRLNFYFKFNTGFDSNANSSTSEGIVTIPIIGPITLAPGSVAQDTMFTEEQVGLSGQAPVTSNIKVFGTVAGTNRNNASAHLFDTSSATGIFGVAMTVGKYTVSIPLMAQILELNDNRFRNTLSSALQVTRPLGKNTIIGGFVEHSQLLYPYTRTLAGVRAQDTDITSGGPIITHKFDVLPIVLSAKGFIGKENNRQIGFPHVSRRIFGTEDFARWVKSNLYQPYFAFRFQRSNYGGIVPGFIVTRHDTQYMIIAGVKVKMGKHWVLDPNYTFINNRSNTIIYDFKRNQFMLSLAYNLGIA